MKTERLLSLDILRGLTVAGMILVNNPGDWGNIYAPLRHAEWNGLTPTDLVFPFFMFVMGVSMNFSFAKFEYKLTRVFTSKLVKRTLVLFLLGLLLSWFSLVVNNLLAPTGDMAWWQVLFPFQEIRILGVLQRLALTYFFASILIATVHKSRTLMSVTMCILIVYALILWLGNGFELSDSNVIAIIDRAILGDNHLYLEWLPDGGRIVFDPEGLLSTLPGVAHVLIGFAAGSILRKPITLNEKLVSLSIVGIVLLFAGLLLNYGCPINKKVWSPTFVLATCGFAYLLLVLLIWLVDVCKVQKWSSLFQAFGSNPLFIYVFASMLAILVERIPINGTGLQEWIVTGLSQVFVDAKLVSLIYALLYVSLNAWLAHILFKRRIFIKI